MAWFLFLAALVIGAPIAFSILLALFWFMDAAGLPYHPRIVAAEIFRGLATFPLLAIPLFVLAGEVMNATGITQRIIAFAMVLVGRLRAGLALVNIWASVIFAGLSGSAVADTSAIGRVFIPEMERAGYPRDFAAALTAASSVIGPIIPPSIPVIIYALTVTGVSVPALFLGGVGPGILLAIALSAYVMVRIRHIRPGPATDRLAVEALPSARGAILGGLLPLMMPVFVVGSIVLGVVTPTEAAALAVFYALILGGLVYRELRLADLPRILAESMRDSAVILIIIAAVSAANWVLTYNRVPNMLTDWALSSIDGPTTFLWGVVVLFLLVGLFLEGIAAMLVLVPILHPIAVSLGIDPTHFGIVVIFNLMIGLITPPLGLCLFVAEAVANVGLGALVRRILPFFLVEVAVLIVITFVPQTVTWLPRLFGF